MRGAWRAPGSPAKGHGEGGRKLPVGRGGSPGTGPAHAHAQGTAIRTHQRISAAGVTAGYGWR